MKSPLCTFCLTVLGALALPSRAADRLPAVPVDAGAPKTHALFMGTDLSVEKDHKLYKVQAVAGTSFVISVDGKADLVPMRGGYHNLKLAQGLKLTAMLADLGELTTTRAYSAGRDPGMKRLLEASRVQAGLGDEAALAQGQFSAAQSNFFRGVTAGNGLANPAGVAEYKQLQDMGEAAGIKAAAVEAMATDITSTKNAASARRDADADLAKELYDAIEVEFNVSSPIPLNDPFLVLVVQYHNPLTKEEKPGNMIHARALERINDKPHRVHLLQGGLPPGYTLDSCQVHIYNYGEEVATNVSPKHVTLTRDEAFGYLLAQYIGTHRDTTAPAEAIIGRLTPQERSHLSSSQITDYYYVKVSRDGVPEAVFADEECTKPVDPAIEALAKNVRFYPALDKGQRVEGVARLVFTHLTL